MTTTATVAKLPGPPVGDELLRVITDGVGAVRNTWMENIPQWEPPAVWNGNGLYDAQGREKWSDSWRIGPSCGGSPAPEGNATYCLVNNTVSWDLSILSALQSSIGADGVYVIIAHEFGHAVQDGLQRAGQSELVWPGQDEMQADCIAGAFLYEASAQGRIHLRAGASELKATLVAVADAEPWRQYGDHGDATQRLTAFNYGTGGLWDCLGPTVAWAAINDLISTSVNNGWITSSSLVTPSGNIRCVYLDGTLQCSIREFDFASPCPAGMPPLITLEVDTPALISSCDGAFLDMFDVMPTEYGQIIQLGPFFCDVEENGLHCINDTINGFDVARAGLRTY